ncbi:holo-ACP synthase [Rhodococcus sp. BP-349]|uniref:Holo-[acyl-carrier-protein] synthase n=1 Tax=Rhodococcoides corynebacterioides TaxID=53972 RepID=A0ABS2KUH2_9NOCA|nr:MULTISPECIES: holo-ACP synthase [Rhodococcus]KQU29384.1 4'-phosphopantetheinyl transferase [Rhodococcus sp. Leaf225]KQU41154.1 4'-phosphopantetheinyl transferase [Rhodococcus sp. Leaf258]MBM7415585.1 holo-[acyl-carrier protein] synthase [Rhodococcus corynebacterioides]MBP1118047.1 holo-[acyl-carrier protein] synthase [Rhodococcus sp. PvP016]MBY6540274.1 holo-ACP synthase [Rhodococcus sp. BP-363]
MSILGVGLDLVSVSEFAEQMEKVGTTMVRDSFTAGERRHAATRSADPARHYAARWAAKEAVLKAWAASRFARAPQIGDNPYPLIEVVNDAWGRPSIKLHGMAAEFLPTVKIHLSLTHDGDMAGAVAILEE